VAMLAVLSAAMSGCREHYPHSFTWPATGDQIPTHPKPPEGGYWSNWDPYAATIELVPVKDVNPVRTQHVLIATVRDHEGEPLPNRRVEWIIAEGSVGDIVEVDESGWRASRGYKQTNSFAVSHTNNFDHVLDMGNDDPSDDIQLTTGQTFCVVTSPVEGDTHIVAYAPGIYDWENHKAFAVKHWYDVAWEWPPPATNPVGTPHPMTTKVMKYSDGTPLENYIVNYKILSGPDGRFDQGGSMASVRTNAEGLATITLNQVQPVEGTNDMEIEIIRPEDIQCCKPAVHIATGKTQKTWIAPQISITKTAPAQAMVGEQFAYSITVSSTSSVPAENVVVTDPLPNGISYVSSNPPASAGGQSLTWNLGNMAPGTSQQITVMVEGTRQGTFTNCAQVTANLGLQDEDCAETVIVAPALRLEKECPSDILVCDPITYTLVVSNPGDGPATNVRITDDLPPGITTTDGRNSVSFDIGTLGAGQSERVQFTANVNETGQFTNRAVATAANGLTAEASCTTTVRKPMLEVVKSAPDVRYIGRPADFTITVRNTGDTDAANTVLTDNIPSGAQVVSASDGGQVSGGRVTWNLGTMAPGASKTVTVTLKSDSAGTLSNRASANAVCADGAAETQMQIKGIPAILLEVVDIEDPIEVGGQETYVITVTNQGSADDTNIVIKATLPPEQEFVSAEGAVAYDMVGKTITFAPLPRLAPKAKTTYRVVSKATSTGDVRFAVSLTSDELSSPVQETESTHQYE
jgi:uncharacterized repeat protein (TIGR01451 family)